MVFTPDKLIDWLLTQKNYLRKLQLHLDTFTIRPYLFFFFLTAWKMEIDYIFRRRIFSSKKSARPKILTEWKTALTNG